MMIHQFISKFVVTVLLGINTLYSLSCYAYDFEVTAEHFYISFIIFFLSLLVNSNNVVLVVRTFFLGIVGYLATAAKIVDPEALFGFHLVASQTVYIVSIMFYMTNVAMFGSQLGFVLASRSPVKFERRHSIEGIAFFKVTFILLLFVSIILDFSHGSNIISGPGYAMEENKLDTGIKNVNSISIILSFMLVITFFKIASTDHAFFLKYRYKVIGILAYLYIYVDLLHGVRMDAVNGIFGLYIIFCIHKKRYPRLTLKSLIAVLASFILIQVIGTVRSNIDSLSFDIIEVVINMILEGSSTGILFYQGTINDLATTFSGIIHLVDSYGFELLYGESYFDWIARTPPAFIYPDRPRDLAWIFYDNGFTSGGGFFELSEVYYNFGIIGALFIPMLISYIFYYNYRVFKNNKFSIYNSLMFLGFMSALLRGLLYQSFAFYKAIVTAYILYFIIISLVFVLTKKQHY